MCLFVLCGSTVCCSEFMIGRAVSSELHKVDNVARTAGVTLFSAVVGERI